MSGRERETAREGHFHHDTSKKAESCQLTGKNGGLAGYIYSKNKLNRGDYSSINRNINQQRFFLK